jgi:hypothetical protein
MDRRAGRTYKNKLPRTAAHRAALSKSNLERNLARPEFAPTEHPTNLDIAWAAGFYEGEGCVSAVRRSAESVPLVALIYQKDTETLYWLKRLFGGRIQLTSNAASCNRWVLSGIRARGFLLTIYQFLSSRRQEQLRAALFA